MKKILFFLGFVLSFNFNYAQDKLILKNGEVVTGRVTAINKSVVRIDSDDAGRVKRYTDKDIEKAVIIIDGKETEFYYKSVPFLGEVLLGEVISGKVSLYLTEYYQSGGDNIRGNYIAGGQRSMYYLKKEGEDRFFDLNYQGVLFNKFQNRVSKYLQDCSGLSKSIKAGKLTLNDIHEIVETYNECGES